MKSIFTTLFILVSCMIAFTSNAQSLAWIKSVGDAGTSEIAPTTSTVDFNKNMIVSGNYTGAIDFDPGAGTQIYSSISGMYDLFVQKFDSSGNLTWAIAFPGNGYSFSNAIQTDASGNIYLAGSFQGPIDLDPGPGTNIVNPDGDQDAFIMKISPAGAVLWFHHYGKASFYLSTQSLAVDNNNEVIVSGYFHDTIDFDPGVGVSNLVAIGWSDLFILKFNPSGVLQFAKSLEGTNYADSKAISIDPSNNIFLTGTFNGTTDFNPGAGIFSVTSNSSDDVFLLKLDNSGLFNWALTLGNGGYEGVADIINDNLGNVYLAGYFSDSIDIDPGPTVQQIYADGYSDMMILKINSLGNLSWAKQIGANQNEQFNSMDIDDNNNIYLAGQFDNSFDADPNASVHMLNSNGYYDGFILSLDPIGNFRMAKSFGGLADDRASSIAIHSNHIFCAGLYKATVDFDPSSTVNNSTALSVSNPGDEFVFRWDICSMSSSSFNAYHCDSVLFNGQYYTSTGSFTDALSSSTGCDSLVTMNLTIGNNNTIVNHTQCSGSSFVLNGQTYTAPGNYIQNYTNAAGCDSNFILNLSFGSPSTSLITDTACDVYFFGSQVLFNTGVYSNIYTNSSGCDSTVYLHLTIKNSSYTFMSVTSCGPYTFNGVTYYVSGYHSAMFVSANGCDSSIDLDLIVNHNTFSTINDTACYSYTFNGQTFTTSGTYADTLTNSQGCDSIITLNLQIIAPNTSITNVSNVLSVPMVAGATYQWVSCDGGYTLITGATSNSYNALNAGNYAAIVNINGCIDTSICTKVYTVGFDEIGNDETLHVYPNPVSEELFIELPSSIATITSYKIYDVTGKVVKQAAFNSSDKIQKILVSDIASGAYILEVISDKKSFVKFVRN